MAPICPHCGNSDQDKIAKVEGKKQSHRPGLYYCNECKGQFTVTVGTVFERSKVPLTKWWMAAHMLNSSKKGVSAHQIHRTIGVTYKTAWFMMHRLREAMATLAPGPYGRLRQGCRSRHNLCRRQGREQTPQQARPQEHRRHGQASRSLACRARRRRALAPYRQHLAARRCGLFLSPTSAANPS